ncbi:TNF receptor-associated factor 4 isoform X2 [Nematostella vectensis]|uniref:TNF receptor-associated factor 4 isoform X2 n=1 Tax=Nematostella vectensis TaxID=45351 RepID=UPI00207739B5|nr:TNF receptor-associated factor 4 isoform X2 [Nematostella vectensis]
MSSLDCVRPLFSNVCSCFSKRKTERSGRLRCPVDNTAIDYSQVYADDVTNQMIMSLTVICDYYQAGCKWKGQLRKLQGHLAECKFVSADCSNSCGARIQKRRMSEHTSKDCPKRRVCCARCKAEMSYEQLRVHSCPALRDRGSDRGSNRSVNSVSSDHVTCPRNCGERMRVQDKARHMREDCLNRWVFCQYCNTEIVFRDRQDHLRRCPVYNRRQPATPSRANKSNSPTVRFEVQQHTRQQHSRTRSSNERENQMPPSNSAPPLRSVSFPASLNHIGREDRDVGRQVAHRGSTNDLSRSTEELDSDIFTCTCGRRISRAEITTHMSDECPRRLTKCQHCRVMVKFEDVETHHQSCPSFPLSCPNNCGVAQIPRGEVELHLSRDCRSNIMQCPFRHAGCHKQFPQRSLQRHIEESVQQHLELVSELAIQQQKEINSLKEIVRHCKPYHDSKLLWRIDDFWEAFDEGKRKPGTELHSPVFYTSNYGYKFKVVLFPYGNGSGEGTHLSLYIRLLPGEYDSLLPWPFEGQITLTLLDQSTDKRAKRHISQSFSPDPNWKSFQRPSKNSTSLGFGYPQFVSHRGLESIGYVRDDVLFLKVTIDCKNAVDL